MRPIVLAIIDGVFASFHDKGRSRILTRNIV